MIFQVRAALIEVPAAGPMVAALEAGPDHDHLTPLGRLVCSREQFSELQVMCAAYNYSQARAAVARRGGQVSPDPKPTNGY